MPEDDDDKIDDDKTRRLIYERLQDAPERQLVDTNDLDTKAATLFAAGSVVMGLVSFGNLGAGSTGYIAGAITTLLILAGVAYAVTAIAGLIDLFPVEHHRAVFAKTLTADFQHKSARDLQEWLIRQARRAWEYNEPINRKKALCLEWIVGGLGAEVLLVVAALIVSRF
jgi:hypothetical protein